MENLKYENFNQREQLNNKIKIAKRILISSWIDMDAEYKATRRSSFISALLAAFFLVFSVVIILFALTYHFYYYEKQLDKVREDYATKITKIEEDYSIERKNLTNQFNQLLDDVSNKYYNYVLGINVDNVGNVSEKAKAIKEYNQKIKLEQADKVQSSNNLNKDDDDYKNEIAVSGYENFMIFLPIIALNLFFIVLLLRHQKKLLADVRYFSHMKYQIRLFSNLLDASQYVAAEMDDYDKAAKYVEDTFTSIREQLLLIGNSQHVEESQNADNDNALLTKILDIFSGQQNQNKQQN